MAKKLQPEQLRYLARLGAAARLAELEAEAAAIRRMFPGVKPGRDASTHEEAAPAAKAKGRRGGSRMSPEARKAQSQRMKRYWAERRQAKQPSGETEAAAHARDAGAQKTSAKRTRKRAKK